MDRKILSSIPCTCCGGTGSILTETLPGRDGRPYRLLEGHYFDGDHITDDTVTCYACDTVFTHSGRYPDVFQNITGVVMPDGLISEFFYSNCGREPVVFYPIGED